jgi:hypothetical protein
MGRSVLAAWLAGLTIGLAWQARGAEQEPREQSARKKLEQLRKQRGKQSERRDGAAEAVWANPDDVTYIDELLDQEWKALGFPVTEVCTDGEFLRRATLDILGRIPTLSETREFLQNRQPNRRTKLIERLLSSEEYGTNFANVWVKLMITGGDDDGNNRDVNPEKLHAWLQTQFNRNTPWNEIVSELISATGRWDENPAVNFIVANQMQGSTVQVTSYLTKLFLCVQTQCTECHDHPWNEWKQEQFHGLNAFFLGTRERRVTQTLPNGQIATDYYELDDIPYQKLSDKGTFFERRSGLQVFAMPTYLDGRDIHSILRGVKAPGPAGQASLTASADNEPFRFLNENDEHLRAPVYLRQILAKVITSDDNPYFARAIVNRMWYHFFGHSFIKNVDDFDNGIDEPTMPELLDRLAADFRRHGYDLKRLARWIATSKAYTLSSRIKGKPNEEAVGFFTYFLVKPLTPEQLYDSVLTYTEVDKASKSANPAAERAAFLREFRQTFGTTESATSAPKYEGTITQALMLMNSALISRATACVPGSFLHRLATDATKSDEQKVEELYLAALCRRPTGQERAALGKVFRVAKTREEALQDVMWVLLNTPEFVLNH